MSTSSFKPMLAGKVGHLGNIQFPVAATPKLDGVRCFVHHGLGPVSRTLKPIPNDFARTWLGQLPPGLDGELIVPNAANFGETSGAVMRKSGMPKFEFHAFDWLSADCIGKGYWDRLVRLADWAFTYAPSWLFVVSPVMLHNLDELLEHEQRVLEAGYEGVMLRAPNGHYKFGRSTEREGLLLKLKRFEDSEAEVIGFDELQHNENEQERDERGYARRSARKAGQVAGGVLGALVVRRPDGVEFRIGSGFTAAQRESIWATRSTLLGSLVTYKHQPHGAKDAPRIPIFKGFRHKDDL